MVILYQHEITREDVERLLESHAAEQGRPLDEYTPQVVAAVLGETARIDSVIDRCSSSWKSHRIAPLERSILRIAVHEMLDEEEIPLEVSIDEAVTLAKRFCSREAAALINGILGKLADEIHGDSRT